MKMNHQENRKENKQSVSHDKKKRIDVMMTAKRIGFALVKNQNDTLNSTVNN
jgi:hypothetical protein